MTAMQQTTKVPRLLELVDRKAKLIWHCQNLKLQKHLFHQGIGATLPGKTRIKNRVKAHPIFTPCFFQKIKVRPNAISTIADNKTTKFLLNETQSGT
jgi:hypothetical protein